MAAAVTAAEYGGTTFSNNVGNHSKLYRVRFGNRNIRTTVTRSAEGVRTWVQGRRPTLAQGARIALLSKTVQRNPTSKARIVLCAFLTNDDHALVFSFYESRGVIPPPITEFLLDQYVFVGKDIQTSVSLLLAGVKGNDGGSVQVLDINQIASDVMGDQMVKADIHHIFCEAFWDEAAPTYPEGVDMNFDRPADYSEGQIGHCVVEMALVLAIINLLV